jgi:hypothetical protein
MDDLQSIKFTLHQMREEQEQFHKNMEMNQHESSKKLTQLHSCVIGSTEYGQKGLVERMGQAEKEIQDYKTLKNKGIGIMAGVAFLWTVLLDIIKNKLMN